MELLNASRVISTKSVEKIVSFYAQNSPKFDIFVLKKKNANNIFVLQIGRHFCRVLCYKASMQIGWLLSLFLGFIVSSVGLAQTSAPQYSSIEINETDAQSRSSVHGGLKAEASSYTSEIPNRTNLNQSFLTTANLNIQHSSKSGLTSKVDASFGKYLDWGGSIFGIQELYTSYQFSSIQSQISIGRKIEFWSQLDSDWQLGLWEPKYNIDALRPMNQGLTGIFYKVANEGHELLFFGAPLFVPTMGPEIREQDGSLVADNRWYRTPSRSSSIMGKDTELRYKLNIPDLMKMVSKPGSGFRYRYDSTDRSTWISLNFARKPINSLLLKYDAQLTAETSTGKVTISPDVGYHSLIGVDVGFYLKNGMISFSYLQDDPDVVRPEYSATSDWVLSQPGQLKIFGAHADTKLNIPYFQEDIGVALDYIRVFEVLTYDVDSQGGDRGSLFPNRTQFTNALSARGKVFSTFRAKPLTVEYRILRDFDQNGTLLGVEMNWKPTQSWQTTVGLDVLGVDNSTDANLDPRFLNQFRANDRFYGGVGYVF